MSAISIEQYDGSPPTAESKKDGMMVSHPKRNAYTYIGDLWQRYLCKRTQFEDEHEVRMLVNFGNANKERGRPKGQQSPPQSPWRRVPVLVEELVGQVIVCPFATESFRRTVRSVVGKYRPGVQVVDSEMSGTPRFF